jgi:hypothetical protein
VAIDLAPLVGVLVVKLLSQTLTMQSFIFAAGVFYVGGATLSLKFVSSTNVAHFSLCDIGYSAVLFFIGLLNSLTAIRVLAGTRKLPKTQQIPSW